MTNYSENIKKLRKNKGLTQAGLASGITSQGVISKIEKNTISPGIDLLNKIAERLDTSLIDLLSKNDNDELQYVYSHINNLILRREYELLADYFYTEPMIQSIQEHDEGYYRWVQAIVVGLHEGSYEDGIEELKNALKCNNEKQLQVRILNNLSAFYSMIREYDEALHYSQQATKLAHQISIGTNLKQQIFFQQARLYSDLKKYREAIFESQLAIQFTVDVGNLFLLDDLYLLLGDSYKELEELKEAKENVDIAYTIAKIKSHSQLMPYIERTQKQIQELSKNDSTI